MCSPRKFVCTMLLVCMLPLVSLAQQQSAADSLLVVLESATGIERGHVFIELAKSFSDVDQTHDFGVQAIQVAQAEGDSALVAEFSKFVGGNLYFGGQFDKAVAYFLRGHDAAEFAGDANMQAWILNELGTVYKKIGDLDRSMEYFEEGLRIAREGGAELQVANSLNNMGIVYDVRGELDKAMEHFRESADMKIALGDSVGLSYNLENMGMVAFKQDDVRAAEAYFLESADIRRHFGMVNEYGMVIYNIGEMHARLGNETTAQTYLTQALEITRETGFMDLQKHILGRLSELLEAQGNYAAALDFHRRRTVLNDSLYNVERSRQIVEMREQFETERKEQTIALQEAQLNEQEAELQRNYLILGILVVLVGLLAALVYWRRAREELRIREAQSAAAIESQERERKRIAQDLHDGLGQMLTTARLHMSTAASVGAPVPAPASGDGVPPEDILDEMHSEIRNIAFNLMPATLVRNGAAAGIEELARRISRIGAIHISVSAVDAQGKLDESQEIALYRVVQEWINNVLKHSGATEVEIQFVGHDDELVVMIEDDGAGFDPALLERGEGHGWKNILTRSRQLRGLVLVDSRSGLNGTSFTLKIPLTEARKHFVKVG